MFFFFFLLKPGLNLKQQVISKREWGHSEPRTASARKHNLFKSHGAVSEGHTGQP